MKKILTNTIQFLFDHCKIKQVQKIVIFGTKVKNWIIKKFAWYIFDTVIKTKVALIKLWIIKKELIIISMLQKIGVCKIMIPLILLFL